MSRQASETPGRLARAVARWRGDRTVWDLGRWRSMLPAIRRLEAALAEVPDERLAERFAAAQSRLDRLAVASWAAQRVLDMRPFDVQLIGALILCDGRVIEMETGEGKTLVAALAAAVKATEGSVHVLTVNDYLAERDAAWMGPLYGALGLSCAALNERSLPAERRAAYRAAVTYLTAKQSGFDYLRDGLCVHPEDRVQGPFGAAIVDEADSILIDEARIPLVIAGPGDGGADDTLTADRIVASFAPEDYELAAHGQNAFLSDSGRARAEAALGVSDLYQTKTAGMLAALNLALTARVVLRREVDYIVRNERIEAVDEHTGRVVSDRQWPDGLQAALEAKEGLRRSDDGVVLGTIALQHFAPLYPHLTGMTATARSVSAELAAMYGLDVVVIPPNVPRIRVDRPPTIFATSDARYDAVIAAVRAAHHQGRPVLVGTPTVAASESLARAMSEARLPCVVLNARTDAQEAAIVAQAGAPGAITIATNMAGRGTDIRLGGPDEAARDRVVAVGGLLVIGTHRHESPRLDRQLRGRAGRQGDPGESTLFLSLEDEVMVRYDVPAIIPERLRRPSSEPLTHPLVARRVDWGFRVIQGRNYDVRHTLWRYSSVQERQRQWVRQWRDTLLLSGITRDDTQPGADSRWALARPERWRHLLDRVDESAALALECQTTLRILRHQWSEHLGDLAALRESLQVVRLGQMDPLAEYGRAAASTFTRFQEQLEDAIVASFDALDLDDPEALSTAGPGSPTSTWTYLLADDPFRDCLALDVSGSLVTSLGAALHAPLYMAVALYNRLRRR